MLCFIVVLSVGGDSIASIDQTPTCVFCQSAFAGVLPTAASGLGLRLGAGGRGRKLLPAVVAAK